jgi:hypothetical protein
MAREFTIKIPENLQTVTRQTLTSDSQAELAQSIAPTLEHIVAAAGITLPPEHAAELSTAFLERGVISIPPGGRNASGTVSFELNSLNYTSKALQRVQPREREVVANVPQPPGI